MKKISIALFMLLGSFSMASAELGVNIGISGNSGVFFADAEETIETNRKGSDNAVAAFGYTSIFIEKTLGSRLSLGYEHIPNSFSTDEAEDTKGDNLTGFVENVEDGDSTTMNAVVNKVKVEFKNMYTIYANLNLTENLYVKAGMMSVDVLTKEELGTGGSYGDTSMDGTTYGLGYNRSFDNGVFVRAEGMIMDFDNITLEDSTNTKVIKATDISGVKGTLSIGKSF